jgi:signal peptidase I
MKSQMESHRIFDHLCLSLLQQGCSVRFQAPGSSMHPTILDGDIITVQPVQASHIVCGDIILYHSQGGVIAHRVVRIHKSNNETPLWILRGDAFGACEEQVVAQQVLGRVVSVERRGRRIDLYSRKGKMLCKVRSFASRLKRHLNPFFL